MFKSLFNKKTLDSLFYPKSIAVIGASNEISKIGGYIFSEILKKEKIKAYPINLKSEKVQNIKAFKSVKDIKKKVDLAIIVIPADFVIDSLRECALSKIKNIVIISAGFKEVGENGKKREFEIKTLIKEYDLNLVGPNCLGFLNPEIELNCSFAKDLPKFGDVALISQSGAVIDAIIDWSFKYNIGFSKIVSVGNMAGIDELEFLKYLKEDDKTNAVVFYMETLERGFEFSKVLKEISMKKPVIIIKPGKSDNAKKAIGSHTGSLAQDNILVETLVKENGGIFVESLNELYNMLIGLKTKIPSGKNTVILTNAGGPGVIATDSLAKSSFDLYRLSSLQKEKFNFLPKEASLTNPIDILGDARSDRYKNTLIALENISEIHNIIVLLTPQIMTDSVEIAKILVEHSKKSKKTIVASFLGYKEIDLALNYFDENDFPHFQTPSDSVFALNNLYKYSQKEFSHKVYVKRLDSSKIKKVKSSIKTQKGLLTFLETKKICSSIGLKLPEKQVCLDVEHLFHIKVDCEKYYVIKVDGIVHKKDVGGVKVHVKGSDVKDCAIEIFEKFSKTNERFSITIEDEFEGIECIVGLKSDSELGDFLMFGMGGTFVSLFKDIHFSKTPLDEVLARKLIEKSKVYELLKGYRGSEECDINSLVQVLVKLSILRKYYPEIKEVDLNPVICNKNGVYLVDVKLLK